MTTYYVDPAGDNSDGLSWAKAKTTIAAGMALLGAGDYLYVDWNNGTAYEEGDLASASSSIVVRGCSGSGDLVDNTQAVIDATGYTNGIDCDGNYQTFANFSISGSSSRAVNEPNIGNCIFENLTVSAGAQQFIYAIGANSIVYDCDLMGASGSANIVENVYIHDSAAGVTTLRCLNSRFDTITGIAISATAGCQVHGCTVYNCGTGVSNAGNVRISQSIFQGNTTVVSTEANAFLSYNCYNGNTSTPTLASTDISDDPLFTDAAGGDFTIPTTSPCVGIGPNGETIGWYTPTEATVASGNPQFNKFYN